MKSNLEITKWTIAWWIIVVESIFIGIIIYLCGQTY